jgi:cysteine desulfurase / selenocysteine lyase
MSHPDVARSEFGSACQSFVYADCAAKTPTPARVLRAMAEYYRDCDGSPGRGVHRLTVKAAAAVDTARRRVADLVGASSDEIVFTSNTTTAIGLVAHGVRWQAGDRILTSLIEHDANYLPWLSLERAGTISVAAVRPDAGGRIDVDDLQGVLQGGGVRLVAVAWASNVLGTIQPVREICRAAHEAGALVLIDGAQGVPHLAHPVSELGCDFLAWSGHKMLGPTGTGALWGKRELLASLVPPNLESGDANGVDAAAYSHLEVGTPNTAGIVGFGEAAALLAELRSEQAVLTSMDELARRAADGLRAIPGVSVLSPREGPSCPVVSFRVAGITPHTVAVMLDEIHGVLVRSGNHCAGRLVHGVLGCPRGVVRASFYVHSSADDVSRLLQGVERIARDASSLRRNTEGVCG